MQSINFHAYLELCKPRVVALMLLTAMIGMFLASPSWVPWQIFVFGIIGIACSAGSAAVVNHIIDQSIDAVMWRTKSRPIPTGRVTSQQAAYFALLLGIVGIVTLFVFVNGLTAILTLLTLIGYAGVYTLFLKRATPQNIVIGGAAGAAPPLLGWTAVTGHIDPQALLLMLIIFVWTPPHFWALAIHRYKDYAAVRIPMLPVTHGITFTKRCIVLYTWLLVAASLLPYAIHMSGIIYLIGAVSLGLGFLYYALVLLFSKNDRSAMQTFRYSIFYLMMLFVILLIDHCWT